MALWLPLMEGRKDEGQQSQQAQAGQKVLVLAFKYL